MSTVKTRSLGLGGAFTAMSDPLCAWEMNPAGAGFSRNERGPLIQHKIFLNGLAPGLLINNSKVFNDGLSLLGTLVKGVYASIGPFAFGAVFGEQIISDVRAFEDNNLFDTSQYIDNRNSSLGMCLSLGSRVSIGASAEIFKRKNNSKEIYKIGYRYGVQVRTKNNIDIGLFFTDLPNSFQNDRIPLERIGDETLNIGIAYHYSKWLTISADLRNVSDEDRPAIREPHIGMEVFPVSFAGIRIGYFQYNSTDFISTGLTLGNIHFSSQKSILDLIRLEATFLQELRKNTKTNWLFITALIVL
ncbi:hypothetical protein KAR48_01785 [bacterium]|nr:hypothetical protein [bacterium]